MSSSDARASGIYLFLIDGSRRCQERLDPETRPAFAVWYAAAPAGLPAATEMPVAGSLVVVLLGLAYGALAQSDLVNPGNAPAPLPEPAGSPQASATAVTLTANATSFRNNQPVLVSVTGVQSPTDAGPPVRGPAAKGLKAVLGPAMLHTATVLPLRVHCDVQTSSRCTLQTAAQTRHTL